MIVKCVVACTNTEGPDFFFCKVSCNQTEYDHGYHYLLARDAAFEDGYDSTMVVFDEHDGPDWLFARFVWATAPTTRSEEYDPETDDDADA